MKQSIIFTVLILFLSGLVCAQANQTQKSRTINIKLKTGESLTGDLIKVDLSSVEFKVNGILRTIPLDDVESINFQTDVKASTVNGDSDVLSMNATLRPSITYKEKAVYTKEARDEGVEGTVVLNVVFTADGEMSNIRVVQGLPHGLTESAISAAQKIRFNPAVKDGKPVSVRGYLEFTFSLFALEPPVLLSPGNQEMFDHYPRKTDLKWKAVPNAVRYRVRIEYGDEEGKNWLLFKEVEVAETEYTFDFLGTQPGRWRVAAIPPRGKDGEPSPWRYFRFAR